MSIQESTLALAGIFQAAELVRQLARKGKLEEKSFSASINSILKLNAPSTEAVYEGAASLETGLKVLLRELGSDATKRQMEVIHYAFGIIILERRLQRKKSMLEQIRSGIEGASKQAALFSPTHPNVLANLADIYLNNLSTFRYRIQVYGEQAYLQNAANANKIRALLLAGIRSAVLWRQKGGNRFQLLFTRGKILRAAEKWLHILSAEAEDAVK